MSLWVTLPPGFDAAELLIHAREHGVLFVPGALFLLAAAAAEYVAAGFCRLNEKQITRGIQMLGESAPAGISQTAAWSRATNCSPRGAGLMCVKFKIEA